MLSQFQKMDRTQSFSHLHLGVSKAYFKILQWESKYFNLRKPHFKLKEKVCFSQLCVCKPDDVLLPWASLD